MVSRHFECYLLHGDAARRRRGRICESIWLCQETLRHANITTNMLYYNSSRTRLEMSGIAMILAVRLVHPVKCLVR
jgi:hypothetical protein